MQIFLAILLGLISMISYGLSSVYSQPLAKRLGAAQLLFLRGIVVSVILAIAAVMSHASFANLFEILLAIGLGVAGYLPVLAFTQGLKISRIGIVAPIAGTSPFVTVLLSALLLGITIHPLQWVAIIVIIGANVAMSIDLKNWRNSQALQLSSGIPYALIATVGWGCFYFFLIYATNWLGPWLSACLVEIGVTFAAGVHVLLLKKKIFYKQTISQSVVANSILLCLGTVGYTVGVRYFNVGVVASLSNSTAIVSALAATYLFHEHLTKKEKLAAAIMIGGIIVLTLF
jgi:drug/metabolite transporter (DMT)-like permease